MTTVVACFVPSPGSNVEPKLLHIFANVAAYEAWLAIDDYTTKQIERHRVHATYGAYLYTIHWNGLLIAFAPRKEDVAAAIAYHRDHKRTIYRTLELPVVGS